MTSAGRTAKRLRQLGQRQIKIVVALTLFATAYTAYKIQEYNFLVSRVPKPLIVGAIEYRLENSWGLGFSPGDNETGFVVYRLTDASGAWAREQGDRLGEVLSYKNAKWHRTPVDERNDHNAISEWHHYDHDPQMMSVIRPRAHSPTVQEYLEKYGFTLPIQNGRDDEANAAIQSAGSFYSYGRGGSVTIVDPIRGKVYFAYAR